MSDDWDAKKVAAECAATARAKTGPAPLRPGEPPPIPTTAKASAADEFRDELGWFKEGNHFGVPRPTKYKPEYVEQARKLAQIGATNAEMADFFEVNRSTLTLWCNVYPELNDAIRVGKERPDERVKRSLYERATGYDYTEEVAIKMKDGIQIVTVRRHAPPDVSAATMWLINRQPAEWKLKRTIEHTGDQGQISPDEARKALEDFYRGGGEIIDVTPTRLTLPDESEAAGESPAAP